MKPTTMNETITNNMQELTAFELSEASGGGPMFGLVGDVASALYQVGSVIYGAVQTITGSGDPWA
jgi:hypothetical protein